MTTTDREHTMRILCDALGGRRLCLFLGAGVNAGVANAAGVRMPLGKDLGKHLASKLLEHDDYEAPLEQVASMAAYRAGRDEVDRCISEQLGRFEPAAVHHALAQLPFDAIFTTNYDTLLERAFQARGVGARLVPVFAAESDTTGLGDGATPYYKLHGCIDHCGSAEGRLTLSIEDYRAYEEHRRPLFKRLRRDLESRVFLFLGYSLRDPNFVRMLDDCRAELDVLTLPRSFAVLPDAHQAEADYWREKYNIQAIPERAAEFATTLKTAWFESDLSGLAPEDRRKALFFVSEEGATFRRIGESFFLVDQQGCTGAADATSFFKGRTASWADVREDVPAERDDSALIWELAEQIESAASPGVVTYAITGAAGTGKTTLCKGVLWSLVRSWGVPVLQQIPGTPLDCAAAKALVDRERSKRVLIYIPAVDEQMDAVLTFLHDLRTSHVPATVLLEERSSLWAARCESKLSRFLARTIELAQLSTRDIESILDQMTRFGCLGRLETMGRTDQVDHFEKAADKELLVALRQLTDAADLDDSVRSEYRRLPSELAKQAYALVCAAGQMDEHLRYAVVSHALKVPFDQLRTEIFTPTKGVLMDVEERGNSRHNGGYRLRARHPLIASIVFDCAFPTDDTKFALIHKLLKGLDVGFTEDRQLLRRITASKNLIATLAAPHRKRALFDILAEMRPGEAHVFQHRSMLERELGDPDAALDYAKKAARLEPHNEPIKNTLGLAYEACARRETDPNKQRTYTEEAERLFRAGIEANPSNPYGYFGLALLMRRKLLGLREGEKVAANVELIEFLEDARDATGGSGLIVSLLGEESAAIGQADVAIASLRKALEKQPSESRIRDQLSQALMREGKLEDALAIVTEGIALDAGAWRLHRNQARILARRGAAAEVVVAAYDAAVRFRQGDAELLIELASFLFSRKEFKRAKTKFGAAQAAETAKKRGTSPQVWRDANGQRRIFTGKVKQISGDMATVVATPDGFEARFWRSNPRSQTLKQGDVVEFTVQFTSMGADAIIRHPSPPR